MNTRRLVRNKSLVLETLDTMWSRDPRDGKPLDCLHFDEYCQNVLKIKDGIDLCLFSIEAALKSALKRYVVYVNFYALGVTEEMTSAENLEAIKDSISQNVIENWTEYYRIINKSYSRYIKFLNSDEFYYS